MHLKRLLILSFSILSVFFLAAQQTGIGTDIRAMSKEADPIKAVSLMNQIIQQYKLDSVKDAETIDVLNGTVAVAFAMKQNHQEFERYVGLIRNKFNQTSFLNMAAAKLLDSNIDIDYALKIAKQTIDVYLSFKDDPAAKPNNFSNDDWKRFMDFAQYPYYDTYAQALFAVKKYKESLFYQRKSFQGNPEDGIPEAVERYAKLLEINGDKEGAKQLLTKLAGSGKLNEGMKAQLRSMYISEHGNGDQFDLYLDTLQASAKIDVMKETAGKMLNEVAPGFSLKDITGKKVHLSDYRGKIVVIDLWATWCKPCIASFPAMEKLTKKHPDIVFLFIAVNEPGNNAIARVKDFMAKSKYDFHVLMDEPVETGSSKYQITSTYRPEGIPAKYVIDRSGKIRFKTLGFDTDSQLINELEAMISIVKQL